MIIYWLGAAGASVLGLVACIMLLLRIWRVPGIWRVLLAYTVLGVGFDAREWWMAWHVQPNIYLREMHDILLQVMALTILFALCRRMGRRKLCLAIAAGPVIILAIVMSLHAPGNTLFRSLNGTFVLICSLVTLSELYRWREMASVRLHHSAEFWMLAAFVSRYASQSALSTWVRVILTHGAVHTHWLEFPVSYLPDALTGIYLICAARTHRHV